MWFKNLYIYQLQEPLRFNRQQLHDRLMQNHTRACGKMERMTLGFTSPYGDDSEELVCEAKGNFMIALKKIEKILPSQVVKDHVNEKVVIIEKEQHRKVGSREKRNLYDEIALSLLPRAFEKSSIHFAYFDLANQLLMVDTSNQTKAEEMTVLLRSSLGSLKIIPLKTAQSVKFCMTEWLKNDDVPVDFTIDESCEMHDPNSAKTTIKCVNLNLFAEEVTAHLQNGKLITQMALTWSDRVSFVMDEHFIIKRIRFLDLVQNQLEDYQPETAIDAFIADFAIFASEFAALIPALIALFGGLEKQEEVSRVGELEVA